MQSGEYKKNKKILTGTKWDLVRVFIIQYYKIDLKISQL